MSATRKITIRDVAAAAGVSVTTVSDALSGKGRLPDETRQKVQATAERLGYRPSAIALGLRERGLGLVGLCIAPAGNAALTDVGYWATIVTYASQTFLSAGLAPVLLPHSVDMLAKLKIPLDGAILVDPLVDDAVLTFFEKRRVRCVTIGRDLNRESTCWLDDDNGEGVERMFEQAVAPGSRIAVVTIGQRKSYAVDAIAGATRWTERHGSSIATFQTEGPDDRSIEAVVSLVLQSGADVILAQHDRLALRIAANPEVARRASGAGLRLLSITDSPELEQAGIPISAVRQRPALLAEMTAKTMIEMINGRQPAGPVLLPMDIIIRPPAAALRA